MQIWCEGRWDPWRNFILTSGCSPAQESVMNFALLSYAVLGTIALFILKPCCGGGNLRASNISTLWHFLCPHSLVWSFAQAGPTRKGQGGTQVVSRGSEWKHVFSRKNKYERNVSIAGEEQRLGLQQKSTREQQAAQPKQLTAFNDRHTLYITRLF